MRKYFARSVLATQRRVRGANGLLVASLTHLFKGLPLGSPLFLVDSIDHSLVWIDVDTPRDRLWATEQLIKAGSCGAILAWLPLVRAEQIRRLQVLAARCRGPVFLCRPQSAARDASAAALRVSVSLAPDWQLDVEVLKRKGPPLEQPVRLVSIPGGLNKIMTPRLRHPSRWAPQIHRERHDHAVDSAAAALRSRSPEPSRS